MKGRRFLAMLCAISVLLMNFSGYVPALATEVEPVYEEPVYEEEAYEEPVYEEPQTYPQEPQTNTEEPATQDNTAQEPAQENGQTGEGDTSGQD